MSEHDEAAFLARARHDAFAEMVATCTLCASPIVTCLRDPCWKRRQYALRRGLDPSRIITEDTHA